MLINSNDLVWQKRTEWSDIFYNLLNLILDTDPTTGDGRRNYYFYITQYTNVNISMNGEPLQGHDVLKLNPVDLIKFNGVNFYHGACGDSIKILTNIDRPKPLP